MTVLAINFNTIRTTVHNLTIDGTPNYFVGPDGVWVHNGKCPWDTLADSLGYTRMRDYPFNSHGQKVYKNRGKFITPDADSHIGGTWKMFDRQGNRLGTYNDDLTVRLGD